MENTILGLDLGSASIGWAIIKEDLSSNTSSIIDLGSRIIPYDDSKEQTDYLHGTGESKNAQRTLKRGARRSFDRYQLRRSYLAKILQKHSMFPGNELIILPKLDLWELRAKAANEQISLEQLGRILMWLNQKRGYKSARSEANMEKKDTDYVSIIKNRYQIIKEQNITIGEYFHSKLVSDSYFRVKENVFPREAYIEEFEKICSTQQQFHTTLTKELVNSIRDEIIYYQRPLKSQKGLVAICEFEGFSVKKGDKEYFVGPKVAHRSNPLFQIVKIWESINNIKINTKEGSELELTQEQKEEIFNYLNSNEKLSFKALCKILKVKEDEVYADKKTFSSGLQGNLTKCVIIKALEGSSQYNQLLKFDLSIVEDSSKETYLFSLRTGEITPGTTTFVKYVNTEIEKEPFYKLWHTIYSINEVEECTKALVKNFGIDESIAQKLANIDFSKQSFGNRSVKVLRKTLPYLIDGHKYSDAMQLAGYNHSNSKTKEENLSRALLDYLKPIPKNSLRQPVVEKILNQMVNLVNEIIVTYGKPDEIRVELARELKQGKEERRDTEAFMRKRERDNKKFSEELQEYGLPVTRSALIKCRLYEEINDDKKQLNAVCIYCGKTITRSDALRGDNIDVDHIIPRTLFFDDSQSNKTLVHRSCNSTKSNQTAYDFMAGKSEFELKAYIERVNSLYQNRLISKSKRDKLLMPKDKIPEDFIERQIKETQYIAKKSKEILNTICYNVWSTSGTVTSELRRLWGWDDVTKNLQFSKYKELGQTEVTKWTSNHGRNEHQVEVMSEWSKRDDHRHHAIDALVVACTKQGFIQRLNTLNTQKTQKEIDEVIATNSNSYNVKLNRVEKSLIAQRPFTVREIEEAVANILISFKAGKKVATEGSRKVGRKGNKRVVQRGIIVPRGSLSKESVYGKIKIIEREKPLKYLFASPDLIIKERIKKLVLERIEVHNGNVKKAIASCAKEPIFLDKDKVVPLTHATCYKEEYVIKYPVNIDFNKVDKVIDEGIKTILKRRLEKFDNQPKQAFKDVAVEGGDSIKWYQDEGLNFPIASVRCLTGLSAVVPIRKDKEGRDIGFVKPDNNHHIAIYSDPTGKLVEHTCTFWHAVERKKYNLPTVIKDSNIIWERIERECMDNLPPTFLEQLPAPGLILELSMQRNEMFLLGLPKEEALQLITNREHSVLSNYLYRVQKIAKSDYAFRHHLETQIIDTKEAVLAKRFYRISSLSALNALNPIKIRITLTGEIICD